MPATLELAVSEVFTLKAAALAGLTGVAAAGEAEGSAGVVHAGVTVAEAIGAPTGAAHDGVMVGGATDAPITDGSDIGAIKAAIAFARSGRVGAGRKRG